MDMDKKEKVMLQHYKSIIENKRFDEYDILGFLIFIRRHINSELNYIQEFADLIAHRERDRGLVLKCISAAIDNEYMTMENGKTIVGYHGLELDTWNNQWKRLAMKVEIALDEEIIKEITLCIFSLSQFTQYDDKNGHSGKIDIFQNRDKSIALTTSENNPHSLYIGFAKSDKYSFTRELSAGYMKKPVEAVRVDGRLRLRDEDGYII